MKNIYLFLFLLLLTGSTITAQEYVNFGVKGGVNISDMNSDNFTNREIRTGFHLGLLAEIPMGNKFSLQPEILYSSQGTKAEVQVYDEGPRSGEFKLDYIQVPVLAKLFLTKSLSIEAGPSFNFLVDEKINEKEADFGSNFEFSGALGTSLRFLGGLFGSARYTYGFTDAFNGDDFDDNINNMGFQLGIGFMF